MVFLMMALNDIITSSGADGAGGIPTKLLLLPFGSVLSFNLFSLFLRVMSSPGSLGAFFIRFLAKFFLPMSSYFSKELTIGFSISNVEISSKTS